MPLPNYGMTYQMVALIEGVPAKGLLLGAPNRRCPYQEHHPSGVASYRVAMLLIQGHGEPGTKRGQKIPNPKMVGLDR